MKKTSASAIRRLLFVCSFLVASLVLSSTAVKATGIPHDWNWNIPTKPAAGCQGSIGECTGTEFEMDSESNRRILATTNYISYGALTADTVPCSQRGASYYNCQTGAQANPYQRGCSAITQCRS